MLAFLAQWFAFDAGGGQPESLGLDPQGSHESGGQTQTLRGVAEMPAEALGLCPVVADDGGLVKGDRVGGDLCGDF